MSFPNKENLVFFENLQRQQERIYMDACDIGIKITKDENQGIKAAARENLLALMRTYKSKVTRPDHARYPYDEDFKKVSETEIFIPFEHDEGMYRGVTLTVWFTPYSKYHVFNNVKTEVLTVSVVSGYQKESPFKSE